MLEFSNETNLEAQKILSPEELAKFEREANVIGYIQDKFRLSADHRTEAESKWLDSLRAWRGEYSQEELAKLAEIEQKIPGVSKVFVKITKTKVQAAIGQIYEVVFANDGFPMGIEPTKVPEGIAETATVEMDGEEATPSSEAPKDTYGYKGDGVELEPGMTTSALAALKNKLGDLVNKITLKTGKSPNKEEKPEVYPAQEAAARAEKVIIDQLHETHSEFALRKLIFEQVCLGTGILKGPVGYDKVIHKYGLNAETKEITYNPVIKFAPKSEFVSVWDFYPDPTAKTVEDCDFVIQRHLMNRKQLRDLKSNSTFDKEAINELLGLTGNFVPQGWEQEIKDDILDSDTGKYEVLEYWGYLDSDIVRDFGIDVPETVDLDLMVNIWTSGNQVLRLVLNPFEPRRLPYFAVPYEEHPYQIWGVGVPENMKDSQALMNGHYRMAIDNLRLAGNCVFEVNEDQLAPGQDMSVYPGKVFRKQGGAPGQSIFSIKFNDTSQSHMTMFDRARQLSDEQTGIPSYSHGSTGVSSTTRTASGMSMLMGAAALNIKTVIKNIDHFLIKPLGEAMYQWNMQFNDSAVDFRGDLEIVARGTSSLMQKEVQSQRLISFMQILASNQITAPLGNYKYIISEIAKALDLDADKVINNPDVAKMYAQLIALQGGQQNANQQGTGQQPSALNGQPPQGNMAPSSGNAGTAGITGNGGGNIGTGNTPMPGEAEFSGNA